MKTDQLAELLDQFRNGIGSYLVKDAREGFELLAGALREFPGLGIKDFVKTVKDKPVVPDRGGRGAARPPAVDVPSLIERIRAVRAGDSDAETVSQDVNVLADTGLKAILRAFDQRAARGTENNRALVRALVSSSAEGQAVSQPHAPPLDTSLVDHGVQLYRRLRDDRQLSISDVRQQFQEAFNYPKPVVEEMTRRLEYTPTGSAQQMTQLLLSNLERLKNSQLKVDLILSGT